MLKKLALGLVALLVLLALALAVNTWRQPSRQIRVEPLAPAALDEAAAADRLAQAVRFRTVSSATDAEQSRDQFEALQAFLQQQFPRLHAALRRERVGGLSLLYTWPGSDARAAPVLLLAHQDVVPVAPGTEGDWQEPPFAGLVKDGFVWGRGSWDDKGNLLAQMEAVEALLASGYQPRRTVYLAYGADEEVSGLRGAARIAALLRERNVRPAFVIDEGLLVLDGVVPGVRQPTALVGVAEKGYASVVICVSAQPGHSSMPPKAGTSAIALLSGALVALEAQQFPARLGGGVAGRMFATLAPEMTLVPRVVLSNLWLFGPLVKRQLSAAPSTNAALRTTTAPTIVAAGNKDNVLPGRAEATVNFRILPGATVDDVVAHVRRVVASVVPEGQFEIRVLPGAKGPSHVAPTDSAQYALLNRTIRAVFPDAVVAPGLMVAATDSAHYDAVSDHVFKFSPIRATATDLKRFHGTNERLSVAGYADAIRFYERLVSQLGAADLD